MISKRTFGQAKMPGVSGNLDDFEENTAPNAKYIKASRHLNDFEENTG